MRHFAVLGAEVAKAQAIHFRVLYRWNPAGATRQESQESGVERHFRMFGGGYAGELCRFARSVVAIVDDHKLFAPEFPRPGTGDLLGCGAGCLGNLKWVVRAPQPNTSTFAAQ